MPSKQGGKRNLEILLRRMWGLFGILVGSGGERGVISRITSSVLVGIVVVENWCGE